MEQSTVPDDRAASGGGEPAVRFVPTAIADPGPLGLGAFALTTFVLSMYNAGLVDKASETVVLGLAIAYGGLAQLLAGMWEFRTGNTFGAVAFTSFGAFWISFFVLNVVSVGSIQDPAALGHGVGLFLIAWGIFTLYMTVAALGTTNAVLAVFALLTVTFFLLGIGNAGEHESIVKAGGWFGLATAVAAWYGSFAGVANATLGRTLLPVGPRGRS